MRYTLAAALDQALTSFESKGKRDGGGDRAAARIAVPVGHPPTVSARDPSQGDLSCPMERHARGSFTGGESSGVSGEAVKLSPQLFAAMDVDERTAIVHRYLSPALLDYVETALQVIVIVRAIGGLGAASDLSSPLLDFLRMRPSASLGHLCCSCTSLASTRYAR